MKKMIRKIAIGCLTYFSIFGNSFALDMSAPFNICDMDFCLQPYIGTEVGYRHITYGGGGNKLFKTALPQAAIYLGLKVTDYFGLEAGYKTTILKSQFVRFDSGEEVMGAPTEFPPEYYIARSQFKGAYGSALGYLPLCYYPIDLIGSIGFIRLKTYHYQALLVDQNVEPNASTSFLATGRNFKAIKTLLTLGLGAQYLYCDTVGFRFKMDWEDTARIRRIKPLENQESAFSLDLKSSMIYNLGIYIPF